MRTTAALDNEALAAERRYLMAYAMFKLRDTTLADDAVQDTLVAAMAGSGTFAGRSSPRTWLVSILRHKICDVLSAQRRDILVGFDESDGVPDFLPGALFDVRKAIAARDEDRGWGSPEATMDRKQFWAIFAQCLDTIPVRLREVFVLREVMGESIEAVCKDLAISASNCSVILYRARAKLRPCMERHWRGDVAYRTEDPGLTRRLASERVTTRCMCTVAAPPSAQAVAA
ncbi:MAG: sigma-70 family RNA polymerase sigma factor [Casimicrobiaceae bacterium]